MKLGAMRPANRGTVTLVSLCFVTVLGITLAGYIAVCSRAMNLSNRTYQNRTSLQLAEMGVDEALRAFNKNNWADWSNGGLTADWTLSGTTATCNIAFPANKFSQGITGSVKIRIDNYNANQLDSTWGSGLAYRVNELVSDSGIWYRCIKAHTSSSSNKPVNWNYWVPEGIPILWDSVTSYSPGTLLVYNEVWYRCKVTNTNSIPSSSTTNWQKIEAIYTARPASPYVASSGQEAVLFDGADLTQLTYGASNSTYPYSWEWSSGTYRFNDVVYFVGGWYRCVTPHTSSGNPNSDSKWAAITTMWNWISGLNYNLGDVVFYSSTNQWYRCVLAHTSSGLLTPSNASYWRNTPLYSTVWDTNRQYAQNDTVRFKGVWYRYINATASSGNLPTNTTYWIGANTATTSYQWSASSTYSVGDYRCYGGAWHKCTTAHTGHAPNDTAYWTSTWANSFGVTTGAPIVYAESTIAIANSPPVRTQLRATIAPTPLFPNALASTTTISANSGGVVDSYDSTTGTVALQNGVANTTTPNLNYGTYASHVGTSTNFSAVVAASTSITLSSTAVKGYLAWPSPPAGIGSSASVKGLSSAASPNVDTSRISRSPAIPQFDTLPIGGLTATWANVPKGTLLPLATTTTIGTPGATTSSRYYYTPGLTLGTGTLNVLRVIGPVILYINGDLFITGSGANLGRIEISSTGSAEIHVAGRFMADANGEGILNYTSDPKSLIIICDTTSTNSHFYSEGVNDLYGVIYIPYSTSSTGYFNDNNNTEIFGAVSANKVTYSGANMNVHYDTSLRYATFGGVDQPYTVTDWRELSSDEQATMP